MCADFSEESRNGTCLAKSQTRLKPSNRAFCNDHPVEKACSDCLLVSKIKSHTATSCEEYGSLKSFESQLSLRKKIEELRSSFVAAEDSNLEDSLEASRKGLFSQISCPKNDAEIPPRFSAKSNTLPTFPGITINRFQFSSSVKKSERCLVRVSAQGLVPCSQKSESYVPKSTSNFDSEPEGNDKCSKKKAEKTRQRELSVQEHTLLGSCHENLEYFSSVTNILPDSCFVASSGSFSATQDTDIRYKKKLKKSHSFELADQTSHPKSFRKENCAPNSSIPNSRENSVKHWSVLTSKPQDLHCRFKKQFNQLHSSFFPEKEHRSTSLKKNHSDSLLSDQKSHKLIRTNTLDSSTNEDLESAKPVTKEPSRTIPMVGGACQQHSLVHHSSDDSTRPTDTEKINAQPKITSSELIPMQVVSKARRSRTTIRSDSNAETTGTSHAGMTPRKHDSTDYRGGVCLGNNSTADFLMTPECISNQNLDLNSGADLSSLCHQVSERADDHKKTTSSAKVFQKTIIQKENAMWSEQNLLSDLRLNESKGEHVVETESTSSKVLYLPVKTLSSQKNCDVELNLSHHPAVVSQKQEEKSPPSTGKSSKLPMVNPGSEPFVIASPNLSNFQPTENECEQSQNKNLELSVSEFKVPLLSSDPKKSVSFQKNCNSGLNEQDSDELALLLADISNEFFSQHGTTTNKETDGDYFSSKLSPCQIPYLTVKKPCPENLTCSDRSLAQLLIVDLLRVTPTFRRNHYMFHNLVVHRVDVFGVVTGVRSVGDYKVLYEVDDGSGSISCMYRTTRTKARLKALTDFLHQRRSDETFNQTTDTIMDESSVERSTERENALEQLMTCMENHLSTSDEELFHKVGDTIHAKGVLYDYRDTISFYAYDIRKVKNMAEEADRYFQMATLYNSTYPKIIRGFKT